jgi:hypothetical protein
VSTVGDAITGLPGLVRWQLNIDLQVHPRREYGGDASPTRSSTQLVIRLAALTRSDHRPANGFPIELPGSPRLPSQGTLKSGAKLLDLPGATIVREYTKTQ